MASKTAHGKANEKIFNEILGLDDDTSGNPLSEMDAFGLSIFPSYDDDISYQLKCIKKGAAVCNADLKTSFSHTQPFILVTTFHNLKIRQGDLLTKDSSVKIRAYLIADYIKYNKLFYFNEYDYFREKMKSVPNGHEYDYLWKPILKEGQSLYKKEPRIVSMAPKRDSSGQNRIQCAIPYKKYINEFSELFEYKDFNGFKELEEHVNKIKS